MMEISGLTVNETHLFSKNDVFTTCRNGRPVRCVLSREEDMIITGKRHPSMCQYKVRTSDHFLGGGVFLKGFIFEAFYASICIYIVFKVYNSVNI